MTTKGNLLFFVSEDWYFAMHFLQFAVAAQQEGWNVCLVCNTGQKGPQILVKIAAAGIRVVPVTLSRNAITPFEDIVAFFQILALVRALKPKLIHAVALKPILISQCISLLMKIPLLAMITGLGYLFISQTMKARLTRPFVTAAFRFSGRNVLSQFVVLNHEDAAWAQQNFGTDIEKIKVIPGTGINLDRFFPGKEPEGPFRLAYVGRMLKDKGVFELIDAIKILRSQNISLHLLLAGAPDASNPASIAEGQLKAWQNEGLCEYLGHVNNIEDLLRSVHAVTLPSYREGLGMSLLEAAATGLPCVTTDVPGCRSAVIDGKTGILVPPKDPQALAEAIRKLIENPAGRRQMGAQARRFVEENFSDEIAVAKMLNLYSVWSAQIY